MSIARKISLLLILLALVLGVSGAVAGRSAEAITQAQIQEQLEKTRDKIDAASKQKDKLSTQIAAIDKKLSKIDGELARLGGEIATVQGKLNVSREKLEMLREQLRLKRLELRAAEEQLQFEEDNLAMRAVAAYKTSDLTYVDVVLASTSFEDLVTRTSMVSSLIGSTDDLVGDLEVARDEVKREKQAVAEKEDAAETIVVELQREEDKLAALQAAQQAQMAASKEARLAKRGALRSVKGNLAEFRRQEQRLLAESAQLAGIATGAGGGGGTGTMIRPVNGPITSGFGYRIHPIFGYRRFHSGVDFGAGYGTPIRAADSGTVVYATSMGGYGNVIMINHGGGISTLYAHQSSFAVTGGSVGKGQVVGYVGSTGWSTGPHLHFEVRVNGSPVDPMGYIR